MCVLDSWILGCATGTRDVAFDTAAHRSELCMYASAGAGGGRWKIEETQRQGEIEPGRLVNNLVQPLSPSLSLAYLCMSL